MRAFDVVWGAANGIGGHREQLRRRQGRRRRHGRLDDPRRRPLLARLPAPRRRRGDQRAHPHHPTAAGRPAPRLRHSTTTTSTACCRASSTSTATTRRPFGFGTHGDRRGRRLRRAVRVRRSAGVRLEGDGRPPRQHPGRRRAAAAAPAPPTSAGTAPIRSTSTAAAFPSRASPLAKRSPLPLSGLLDFTAGGSGTFDVPRYDVRGTIRDFFVADEGIGQVVGDISINGDLMTLKLEAASPRLAVSGLRPHRADARDGRRAVVQRRRHLARPVHPRLRAAALAVHHRGRQRQHPRRRRAGRTSITCWSTRRSTGSTLSLFDYRLRNATPIRLALDRHSIRV